MSAKGVGTQVPGTMISSYLRYSTHERGTSLSYYTICTSSIVWGLDALMREILPISSTSTTYLTLMTFIRALSGLFIRHSVQLVEV